MRIVSTLGQVVIALAVLTLVALDGTLVFFVPLDDKLAAVADHLLSGLLVLATVVVQGVFHERGSQFKDETIRLQSSALATSAPIPPGGQP
jgi:hypothetical protein